VLDRHAIKPINHTVDLAVGFFDLALELVVIEIPPRFPFVKWWVLREKAIR
jgi:hypothetical protein